MKRPNVLIVCVDEMRADHMGCSGNPMVRTPNLDQLAAAGTTFARSYCNNPICMPARATMFTGLLPRDHGLRINGQGLRRDLPTLPGALADAGYRTHAAGKLHLTPWVPALGAADPATEPEALHHWNEGRLTAFPVPYFGFQSVDFVGGHTSYAYGSYIEWLKERGGTREQLTQAAALESPSGTPQTYKMGLPEELHYNRFIADSTMALIRETADSEQPFFTWCSFPDPHMPVAPPRPYSDMYPPADVPVPPRREGEMDDLPAFYRQIFDGGLEANGHLQQEKVTDAQWQEMIARTYGMITHIDTELGRILNTLDETGTAENTVIVFLSDHGDMMGDHGLLWKGPFTFQGCIRIPTIVAAPGAPGGRTCEALIAQIDLMPSLLELCNVAMPGHDWQDQQTTFSAGGDRMRWGQIEPLNLYPGRSWTGLLDGRAARIRDNVVIENDNPPTGYQIRALVTETHRLTVYPGSEDGELFDLVADPHELKNLWNAANAQALKHRLIAELLDAYSRHTPYHPVPPWNS